MTYRTRRSAYNPPRSPGWSRTSQAARHPVEIRPGTTAVIGYPRLALLLVCLIAVGFVSWRIVEISAGRSFIIAGDFQAALEWDAHSVDALDDVAEYAMRNSDSSDLPRQSALKALAASPLDDRAFALLALDANRRGDHALAAKLMQIAGSRSWRYPVTQAWLFSNDVAGKRYVSALEHLDALLRLNENNTSVFLPLVASFTVAPEPSGALTSYLAQSPPWRSSVLKDLVARLRSRDRLVQLFESLQGTSAPSTDDETSSLLDRLIKDKQYALAKQVAGKLQGATFERHAGLYNGDFSARLNGSPFNWRITNRPGVETAIVKDAGGSSALQLDFVGRVSQSTIQQLVTLAPGLWSLTGEVRAAQLRSDMGVGWQLTCAESDTPLMQPQLETGSFDWKQFSVAFSVPEQGCEAQRLTLVHPARVASEESIRGQIWYKNLQIALKTSGAGQ